MTALRELMAEVERIGARLVFLAPGRVKVVGAPIPDELVERLRPYKHDIAKALGAGSWGPADWLAYFNERAGIAEHEGSKPRSDAEHDAFEHCVARWLAASPPAVPDQYKCLHCGVETASTNSIALALSDGDRRAWLHQSCHERFVVARRADAEGALSLFGIDQPTSTISVRDNGRPQS